MLDIIGPLGNGFPLEEAKGKKASAYGRRNRYPAYAADWQKRLERRCRQLILGYRDELFLDKEFASLWKGLCGNRRWQLPVTKGNVLDADPRRAACRQM